MKGKTVKESQSIMTQLMMPNDANFIGNIFGGVLLRMVDAVSFVCATKHAGTSCVTAAIDRVIFEQPIYVGDFIVAKASVNYVGKTSMEVGVMVEAHNLETGEIRQTNSCYVTMVAINKKGKPQNVPALILETDEEKRRYAEAQKRRESRLQERALKKRM